MRRSSAKTTAYVPANVYESLRSLGIEPVRLSGDEIWARCPGHPSLLGRKDRHVGSWSVNARSGQHYCYACGFSGSFLRLVSFVTGSGHAESKSWLVRQGLRLNPVVTEPEEPRIRVDEASLVLFDPVPRRVLDDKGLTREAVEHYGVLWDRAEDRWVLPIRSPDGELWGWQYKGKGDRGINYPRGVRKRHTLFGLDVLENTTLIVVESPLDAVWLHSLGYEGAVSSFGAHIRPEQRRLLMDHRGIERIILALDDDDAGWKATASICTHIGSRISDMRIFNYDAARPADDQKDPGDLDSEQVTAGLTHALPWYLMRHEMNEYLRQEEQRSSSAR